MVVSNVLASEEMTKLKDSSYDASFDASVRAFTYTMVMEHLDWGLSFLSEKLSALVDEWYDQWRATLPQSDEPPVRPSDELLRTPSSELLMIPPPLEVHPEQVIKDNSVVNLDEGDDSDDGLERIDDPRGVLD